MPARLQDKAAGALRRMCPVCVAMDCLSRKITPWLPSSAFTGWRAYVRLSYFIIAIANLRSSNCQSAALGSLLPPLRAGLQEKLGRRQFFRPGDLDRIHRPNRRRFCGYIAFAFDLS